MTPVQHAGDMEVPKRIAQAHRAVQEGEVEEATAFCGGRGNGGNLKVAQCLWAHPRDGIVFQVPGESYIGI